MDESFRKPYDPKKVEDKIYRLWEKSGYFNPDRLPTGVESSCRARRKGRKIQRKPNFCIVIPPPNVTGELHMGHALNAVIQDILIRQKRMQGYRTLWLPGTDHAGIATQNVVEKKLKKGGLTRYDLGRERFIEEVWKWKERYGNIILDQFKKLGSSCDWSRTRFTMDKDYVKAVEAAFLYYYEKGWIYRGDRVVNWCPRCQTSLSDLEIEYKEEPGHLWFIKYPLAEKSKSKARNFIVVATTRPETMLGDAAVAVNPKDKRYKGLAGKTAILPIMNREIPIIADRGVEMGFGTGAVKVTPAHDMLDAEIGKRHKLPVRQVIDPFGKMSKEAGKDYGGLSVKEAREKVVAELEGGGLIEKTEDYNLRAPKCYRCNFTIEPQVSKQWFLKMSELAKKARQAIRKGDIKFHPKRWEKIYFAWLNNIKDWCISRQIWWGHRLPVWQCQAARISEADDGYFVSLKKPKKCLLCGKCKPKQVNDVLDTWFSSALWPFAALGWPSKVQSPKLKSKSDFERFYPTQVLSTARDIINLWVARMIFSGIEIIGKKPFSDVIIHPTILTKEGKRMSKSLGTGIDPMLLIEKYGADATRFGLIYQMMGGQDIRWNEATVIAGKKFANKIWNASRFVLMQNEKSSLQNPNSRTAADKKILKQLASVKKLTEKDLKSFNFGKALRRIYDFFWHQFCDKYLEASKKQPNKQALLYVLAESLKLLHPFMPFITEEIWQNLPIKEKKLLMVEKW